MARPLSDLPVVLGRMAKAAGTIEKTSVGPITNAVAAEARRQGGRYGIKGKRGTKVPLGARANVKAFGSTPTGQVSGSPAGFWRIVEEGSSAHLIAGRHRRTRIGRGFTARANTRRFIDVGDFSGHSPIRLGSIGWRQYAVHPGHGSIGRPWRNTMRAADGIVSRELTQVASKQFTAAWK